LPDGRFAARLTLNTRPRLPPMTLSFSATGLPAGPVVALLGLPGGLDGTLEAGGELRAAGASWHDIAANLTGRAGVAMTGGTIGPGLLAATLGPVLRVAGVALPADSALAAHCLAARLDAERGIVNLRAFVLDAPPLLLRGDGAARLADERATFRLQSANGVPVRVSGVLAALSTAADQQRVADDTAPSSEPCVEALALARAAVPRQ
jgi:hypothetical protein